MWAHLIPEIDRARQLIIDAALQFTEDDWHEVYVLAHKLTAELKVARAKELTEIHG